MNSPIDIVVTYVNNQDPIWQELFQKYQQDEINKGTILASNQQALGKDRFRDWDIFKYWFRSTEKNCPWFNKIFLIVQNKNQLPSWLNQDNPRLKIVYHDEFIPKELLPVFNSRPIEFYTCKIKDLSKNYIRSNDDCYFMNLILEDRFFKNNKPILPDNRLEFKPFDATGEGASFWGALNNNMKIEKEYLNGKDYTYGITHLQMPCDKEFELSILDKYNDTIFNSFKYSHFRNKYQHHIYLFDNLERLSGNAIIDNDVFKNCGYFYLKPNLNYQDIASKDCVCINDTNKADKEYNLIKQQIQDFFENHFPEKSSFEL